MKTLQIVLLAASIIALSHAKPWFDKSYHVKAEGYGYGEQSGPNLCTSASYQSTRLNNYLHVCREGMYIAIYVVQYSSFYVVIFYVIFYR